MTFFDKANNIITLGCQLIICGVIGKMADLNEYKCPCCLGALAFDSASQKMLCPFCGTSFEMEAVQSYDTDLKNERTSEMNWDMQTENSWHADELAGLLVYSCQSCGGEITGDSTMGATTCPYCGNNVVVKGQFSGSLRPDYIIPFKLDKNAAKAAYNRHVEKRWFLPPVFRDQNHIDEIKGLYVPFWLFDADADANIRYKATTISRREDSTHIHTTTSFFSVVRGGTLNFEKVPVDGSSKMDNDMMDSIEPYKFSEITDFQTAYLAGFLADKYDEDAEQSIERANERIIKSTEAVFAGTANGYTSLAAEHKDIRLQNGKVKYALLPVWVLNTTWQGKKFMFAMNGQTGKLVGDLPLDKAAYWRWFFIFSGIFAVVIFLIQYLVTFFA